MYIEVIHNSKSIASESYRTLRSNIQFSNFGKNLKIIVITSANPNEGKSEVSLNLTAALAQQGKKVILIDIQGLTGKKKEVLIIPFSKITAFSTETAGTFDFDLEVKIWASGIGFVELSFSKGTKNFRELTIHLAKYIK